MGLYISPKKMIADKRLNDDLRAELAETYMPKIEHKSQLIKDLNFIRSLAKKHVAFYYDINAMTLSRAYASPALSENLALQILSDTEVKHKDAIEQVRKLTAKINIVTKELSDVVAEMNKLYTEFLVAKKAKPAVRQKDRQNYIRMNRRELRNLILELTNALYGDPNETDFCINLLDLKAHRN